MRLIYYYYYRIYILFFRMEISEYLAHSDRTNQVFELINIYLEVLKSINSISVEISTIIKSPIYSYFILAIHTKYH